MDQAPAASAAPPQSHAFVLPDMSCGHCVRAITEAVRGADPQAELTVDLPARSVQLRSALSRQALAAALAEAGYAPAG